MKNNVKVYLNYEDLNICIDASNSIKDEDGIPVLSLTLTMAEQLRTDLQKYIEKSTVEEEKWKREEKRNMNCPNCGTSMEDTDPGAEETVYYCMHCNVYLSKEDL